MGLFGFTLGDLEIGVGLKEGGVFRLPYQVGQVLVGGTSLKLLRAYNAPTITSCEKFHKPDRDIRVAPILGQHLNSGRLPESASNPDPV